MFESGARKVKPPETGPLLPAPQRLARQKKAKLRTTATQVLDAHPVVGAVVASFQHRPEDSIPFVCAMPRTYSPALWFTLSCFSRRLYAALSSV